MKPHPAPLDTASWLLSHDTISVVPLADALVDALGYDARGHYAEAYWLGVLGPSALLALRRLNNDLDDHPRGFHVPLADLARELGLGHGPGRNAPVIRTLSRLATFGLVAVRDDDLAVRRSVPRLSRRHLARLPVHLVERHQAEAASPVRAETARLSA